MCNILKRADCRTKRAKILDSRSYEQHMYGTVRVFSLSSVWDHLVHFEKFLMLRFSKGYRAHIFHPISTKLCGKYGNPGEYRLLLRLLLTLFRHFGQGYSM